MAAYQWTPYQIQHKLPRTMREPTTAYTADRAAALAGVPQSTVHYWARTGLMVPSVSAERVKLWSFSDLMSLRTVEWLRNAKATPTGHEVPAASMPAIRRALRALRDLDLSLWSADTGPGVIVDATGKIIVRDLHTGAALHAVGRAGELQHVASGLLDVLAPFAVGSHHGPDLRRPRPRLRIVPGKLAGAPHIESTRLETVAVHALAKRGFAVERIAGFYPFTDLQSIQQAIELENELQRPAA